MLIKFKSVHLHNLGPTVRRLHQKTNEVLKMCSSVRRLSIKDLRRSHFSGISDASPMSTF